MWCCWWLRNPVPGSLGTRDMLTLPPEDQLYEPIRQLKLIHPPLHLAHQTVSSSKTTSAASLSASLHLFNQVADVSCFFVFEGSSSLQYPKFLSHPHPHQGFSCGSAGKESACNARDLGLIPGLGRSPGEGNGYPLQLFWRIPWTV